MKDIKIFLFLLFPVVAFASSVEEEMGILQDRLWEAIQSTNPESVDEFTQLSAAIAEREGFLKKTNYVNPEDLRVSFLSRDQNV